MVTYGDMMSLLLCFFVILVSMSEIKKDQRFYQAMESLREALGATGGSIGPLDANDLSTNEMIKQMEELVVKLKNDNEGFTQVQGITGRDMTVSRVREGLQFTISGRLSFDPGKAELKPDAMKVLAEFAKRTIGHNTKIEIRGHTANTPLPPDSPYNDFYDLSFARAKAVKDYLVSQGIREERIRLVACGDTEPLVAQAYTDEDRTLNRRVEIILKEAVIEQFQGTRTTAESGELING